MTLAIGHAENGRACAVLDAIREIRAPFSPAAVVAEFAELLRNYRISSVTGDKYAGEWPAERFHEHGINYQPADKPKSDIYRELLPILNAGGIELLDNPRLVAQLCALERRTARGGRDSIDHPPGAHDDVCNAVAGVAVALIGGSPFPGWNMLEVYRREAERLKALAAKPRGAGMDRCEHGVIAGACRACLYRPFLGGLFH
jgi:hypothetical protein